MSGFDDNVGVFQRFHDGVHIRDAADEQKLLEMIVVKARAAGQNLHALRFQRLEIGDGRTLGAGDVSAAVVEENGLRQRVLLRKCEDKRLEQRFAERFLTLAHMVLGNGDDDVLPALLGRSADNGVVGPLSFRWSRRS